MCACRMASNNITLIHTWTINSSPRASESSASNLAKRSRSSEGRAAERSRTRTHGTAQTDLRPDPLAIPSDLPEQCRAAAFDSDPDEEGGKKYENDLQTPHLRSKRSWSLTGQNSRHRQRRC